MIQYLARKFGTSKTGLTLAAIHGIFSVFTPLTVSKLAYKALHNRPPIDIKTEALVLAKNTNNPIVALLSAATVGILNTFKTLANNLVSKLALQNKEKK